MKYGGKRSLRVLEVHRCWWYHWHLSV